MLHRPVNQPLAKTLPAELAQLPETVMIHDRHRLLPERQVWPQIPSRPTPTTNSVAETSTLAIHSETARRGAWL
jgi:hypothetical protein